MAVRNVVAVFDEALQAFGNPVFVPANGAAVRSFTDEVNSEREGNALNAHPEDFVLYFLATWDEETGEFCNTDRRVVLVRGKDVIQRKED